MEPSPVGRKLGAKRVTASTIPIRYVGLDGQDLPLEDRSVDAALSTFTLCTIPGRDRRATRSASGAPPGRTTPLPGARFGSGPRHSGPAAPAERDAAEGLRRVQSRSPDRPAGRGVRIRRHRAALRLDAGTRIPQAMELPLYRGRASLRLMRVTRWSGPEQRRGGWPIVSLLTRYDCGRFSWPHPQMAGRSHRSYSARSRRSIGDRRSFQGGRQVGVATSGPKCPSCGSSDAPTLIVRGNGQQGNSDQNVVWRCRLCRKEWSELRSGERQAS